ncbi:unnamed protein product [Didymodactylos carnosus]|uniref:DED domain-containing protein n=1 Tax=Didymodactylos carnosus TaxID=1234261 RepID=A0A815ANL3_9BILA|nr:unnamed protein product [Didymodactylos carnosus]CAF1258129.1 unnamed protein product [Didymodactylos carnosus]CAF3849405.1 unnamed protein product [Didymodactylos carnosus]CAF4033078.1 unnamed protein product [Didymodactylos carnosus]
MMDRDLHCRNILLKAQDRLSDNDRKKLYFLVGNIIPRALLDDQSTTGTLNLLEALFDRVKISVQDCSFLIDVFETIGCSDVANLLREGYQRTPPATTVSTGYASAVTNTTNWRDLKGYRKLQNIFDISELEYKLIYFGIGYCKKLKDHNLRNNERTVAQINHYDTQALITALHTCLNQWLETLSDNDTSESLIFGLARYESTLLYSPTNSYINYFKDAYDLSDLSLDDSDDDGTLYSLM